MNCKNCSALSWHPNKGFYCTVPNCRPNTSVDDVREIYRRAYGETNKNKHMKENFNKEILHD